MRRSYGIIFLVTGILFGLTGLLIGSRLYPQKSTETNPDTSCNTIYEHIDSELRCNNTHFAISKVSYLELRTKITNYIKQLQQEKTIDNAAVYFRDLKDGPTFGINAYENYVPASLLKVPLLVTILRMSENDPKLLAETRVYGSSDPIPPQTFLPKDVLITGQEYTIDELLTQMITNSDNTAYLVIFNYLKEYRLTNELLDTYHDLGLILPQERLDASLTVKNYSSLFRILYSSAYLSRSNSEKALALLAKSTYKDALVAGIPEHIEVAHKFGERFDENGPLKELHDCGIVYFPENPYSLCVMTRGTDFAKLTTTIKTISKLVYEEVNQRKLDK
jgi:beta-lactamase class A